MTAFPVLSVRIAFATAPFAAVPTYTEIGPASGAGPGAAGWVRKITTKRGRQRLLRSQAQFEAGTMTASLDNRDRRFDPTNTAGPYYPNIQPMKLVQVGATWAGVFHPIWTGYADDFPQKWPGFSEAEVPLSATDFFKTAANALLLSSGYQKQILADTPVAYYRMGDPAGSTVAMDSSGNGFTASLLNTVTFGQAGALPANVGSAVLLVGAALSAGEIDTPAGIFTGTVGVSFECWVKTTTPAAGLLSYIGAGLSFTAGIPKFNVVSGLGATATSAINDGLWHHVVGTSGLTGGAGTQDIYVDGQHQGSVVAPTGPLGTPGVQIGLAGTNVGDMEVQEVAFYNYQLTAAQVLKHFQLGAWPAAFTGQVIGQILDSIGFPTALRQVDTGRTFCQADVQDETQTKALDQMQKLEQTEQGQLFMGPDGKVVFQDRYHRYESPNATSQATMGDGGSAHPTEVPYSMGGVVLNFDWDELFNDVPVTRRNGVLQEAVNQTSKNTFGPLFMPGVSDLLMATDIDALYCAEWILADTAFPQFRVGDLILDPTADARLWPLVLTLDVGSVITVVKHNIPGGGAALSLTCRIEGIEHNIDAPHAWKTVWHVSLVGTNPWFILDDPVMGILDAGNRWGW